MKDVGEKSFLSSLLPNLSVDPRFVNGFGHDASVIDLGLPDVDVVMKIDRAAKSIAALNGWSDFRSWGRIAVTANASDILAVGGRPAAFMLSISVEAHTSVDMVSQIIAGAAEECAARGVAFLGGDTKEASGVNIVGAGLGTIGKGRHLDRHRAQAGDLVVLAGTLGGFVGGYWICKRSERRPVGAVHYLSHPEAAWREAPALASLTGVHSACDLSDGLASSSLNLVGSEFGAVLNVNAFPFHPLAVESAAARRVDILPYAFGVGDWGILYAVDPSARGALEQLREAGLSVSIIGSIIEQPGLYVRRGALFALTASENEHFRRRMEDEGDYLEALEKSVVLTPVVRPYL
jgi:thiamine-monophosphate kinase